MWGESILSSKLFRILWTFTKIREAGHKYMLCYLPRSAAYEREMKMAIKEWKEMCTDIGGSG